MDIPGVGTLPVLGDETEVGRVIGETNADTVALAATEHLGPEGIRELSGSFTSLTSTWWCPRVWSMSQVLA